jgi:D-3-phosphoglycerate dehydrogenase
VRPARPTRAGAGPAVRDVFLVQPIHEAGRARLRAAGLAVRQASGPDMATVAREIGRAEAAITRNAGLAAPAMDAAPGLRLVVVHGRGHDRVDLAHAAGRGIVVCNTPARNAWSVAEHAIALLLGLAKQLLAGDRLVRAGRFGDRDALRSAELRGRTLGIVGCGQTGLRTAALARRAFRMRVLGYSPSADRALLTRRGIELCRDLDRLLEAADIVSLHAPLRPETRGLIGARELGLMKPGALLVNTARGGLVDEAALAASLAAGRVGGAALDVFAVEPPPADHPLFALPNVLLSPHVAGSSEAALAATAEAVADAVLRFAAGRLPPGRLTPARRRAGAGPGRTRMLPSRGRA